MKFFARILRNLADVCGILIFAGNDRFSYNVDGFVEMLQDVAGSCRILQDLARSCKILENFSINSGISEVFQDVPGFSI